jgi:membrane-associated phospholipid phosphatase
VYALELLPVYDAIARMRVRAHWHSDVLAGFALGSEAGYFAHSFQQPIFLGMLPHGFTVGLKSQF